MHKYAQSIPAPARVDIVILLCIVPAMEPKQEPFFQHCYHRCMKLAAYLIAQNLTPAMFARQIGVGRMTIHRYISGERQPTAQITDLIHKATQGQVTAQDFWLTRMDWLNRKPDSERPFYPWSRETAVERQKADDAFDAMMDEPLEGFSLSPVLQEAIEALGNRAQAQADGSLLLDGRPIRPVDLVRRANIVRDEQGKPLLHYPGA